MKIILTMSGLRALGANSLEFKGNAIEAEFEDAHTRDAALKLFKAEQSDFGITRVVAIGLNSLRLQ